MSFRVGLDTSALDQNFKDHSVRGIGRYVHELKDYLARQKPDQIELGTFSQAKLLGSSLSALSRILPRARTQFRQQFLTPLKLLCSKSDGFDALHFPAHMDAPVLNVRNYIVTVLDLIPLVFRDLYRPAQLGLRYDLARWLEVKAIRNASFVITISQNTAEDVKRLLGVPAERIAVTPLGVDQKLLSLQTHAQLRPELLKDLQIEPERALILYVGGIDQRKNVDRMLQSFKLVKEHFILKAKPPPKLLIAGSIEKDRQFPKLLESIKSCDLSQDVKLLGFLPDQTLFKLYSICEVFFFPSLYEGFGLTPLEAMACGAPVVSSDSSAMPEVLADAALFFNPNQAEKGAQCLIEVLENKELAQRLRAKGRERARLFSWEKTGESTLRAYQQALKTFPKNYAFSS